MRTVSHLCRAVVVHAHVSVNLVSVLGCCSLATLPWVCSSTRKDWKLCGGAVVLGCMACPWEASCHSSRGISEHWFNQYQLV